MKKQKHRHAWKIAWRIERLAKQGLCESEHPVARQFLENRDTKAVSKDERIALWRMLRLTYAP